MLNHKSWLTQLKQLLTNFSQPSRSRRSRRSGTEQLESRQLLAATPVGGEFLVNTTTVDSQSAASMGMDADGDYVVAWQSYLQDGSGTGIYAQRYDAAGVAQGGEFRVNTTTVDNQSNPAVAMDADGDFVIAWQSNLQDGNSEGVYAQRYDAAGIAVGGDQHRLARLQLRHNRAVPIRQHPGDGVLQALGIRDVDPGIARIG